MLIPCPCCGPRDRREFTYTGDAVALKRPAPGAGDADWDAWLHLRDNPAGETRDLWYHDPCGTWAIVTRDTVTHRVAGSVAVAAHGPGSAAGSEGVHS
jgi:methylglutamate dehydrogenase subunit B